MTIAHPIAVKLERLETKPALVLDHLDYELRDVDGVRTRLAEPLADAQRVERRLRPFVRSSFDGCLTA